MYIHISRLPCLPCTCISCLTPPPAPHLEAVLLGADDGLDGEGELLLVPHVRHRVAHQSGQDRLGLDVRGAVPFQDFRRVEALPQEFRRQLQQLPCAAAGMGVGAATVSISRTLVTTNLHAMKKHHAQQKYTSMV